MAAIVIGMGALASWKGDSSFPEKSAEEQFIQGVMGRPLTAIERETRRIKPTTTEIVALTAARAMLSRLGSYLPFEGHQPQWLDNDDFKQVLTHAQYLASRGLSPTGKGYESSRTDPDIKIGPGSSRLVYVDKDEFVLFDVMGWWDYLQFVAPYLEEFGMERALHETRRYNVEG